MVSVSKYLHEAKFQADDKTSLVIRVVGTEDNSEKFFLSSSHWKTFHVSSYLFPNYTIPSIGSELEDWGAKLT